MKNKVRLPEKDETGSAAKRGYVKPSLSEYGRLHELTKGGSSKGPNNTKDYGSYGHGLWS